jgi:hypothetical protein
MGSNSSSCTEKYADWESGSDYCCKFYSDERLQLVKRIRWKSVPMTNGAGLAGVTTVRVLSLGLTELKWKGQSFNHDVVEIEVMCFNCFKYKTYTAEFGSNGTEFRNGSYNRYVPKEGVLAKDISNNLMEIKKIFTKNEKSGGSYNSGSYNCKTWAKSFYNQISDLHIESKFESLFNFLNGFAKNLDDKDEIISEDEYFLYWRVLEELKKLNCHASSSFIKNGRSIRFFDKWKIPDKYKHLIDLSQYKNFSFVNKISIAKSI